MTARFFLPLLLLLTLTALAHAFTPASIHLTIHDDSDHPLPAARVTVSTEDPSSPPVTLTTNSAGEISTQLPLTQLYDTHAKLTIEKDGFPTFDGTLYLFDGAQIDRTFLLLPTRTTTIHLRGPKNEPLEGVSISPAYIIRYPGHKIATTLIAGDTAFSAREVFFTDAKGDLRWTHPPLDSFRLTIGGGVGTDSPPIATASSPTDTSDFTVTLTGPALGAVYPARILQGKLLLPDGSPATNWFIAHHLQRHTGSGFSGGIIQWTDTYSADRSAHPNPDGSFTIANPTSFLGLISPEGFQFLYSLNPAQWPPGVHSLTLTTPPSSKVTKKQFVDSTGKPLANVLLRPTWMKSGAYWWEILDSSATGGGMPGDTPWKIVSDQNGFFDFPEYLGTQAINYQIGPSRPTTPGEFYTQNHLTSESPADVMLRPWPTTRSELAEPRHAVSHHIILSFVDQNNQPVYTPHFDPYTPSGADHFTPNMFTDIRGFHYFLDPATKHLDITLLSGEFQPFYQQVTFSSESTQTYTLHLIRNKPLSGQVLDDAGQPVPNAYLSTYILGAPQSRGTLGETILDHACTDSTGHFSFPGAPDNCFLALSHGDFEHADFNYIDPITITPDARTVNIKLTHAASLRVLLPESLRVPSTFNEANLLPDSHLDKDMRSLRFDPTTHSLFASAIAPGPYHLDKDAVPALGNLSALPIIIEPAKENTLDLRDRPFVDRNDGKIQPQTLTVELNGKPVSGAEVALFTDSLPPDILRQAFSDWQNAKIDDQRRAAERTLQGDAGAAIDVIAAAPPVPGGLAETDLIDDLTKSLDGLELLTSDLSDTAGVIHCTVPANRPCVAVARIRGQFFGWQKFTAGDVAKTPLTITLQPMRSIVVNGRAPNHDWDRLPVKFTHVSSLEQRALVRGLNDDHLWNDGPFRYSQLPLPYFSFQADMQKHLFTFPAMPVGVTLSIEPPEQKPIEIPIPPGQTPLEIPIP